jgi:hypothetical protein
LALNIKVLPAGCELFQLSSGTVELWVAFSDFLSGAEDAQHIRERFADLTMAYLCAL